MAKKWYSEEEIQNLIWAQREQLTQDILADCGKISWFREFNMGGQIPDFLLVSDGTIHIFEIKITVSADSFIQVLKYKAALQDWLFSQRDLLGDSWRVVIILAGRYIDSEAIKINRCFFDEIVCLMKIDISPDEDIGLEYISETLPTPYSKDLELLKHDLVQRG